MLICIWWICWRHKYIWFMHKDLCTNITLTICRTTARCNFDRMWIDRAILVVSIDKSRARMTRDCTAISIDCQVTLCRIDIPFKSHLTVSSQLPFHANLCILTFLLLSRFLFLYILLFRTVNSYNQFDH